MYLYQIDNTLIVSETKRPKLIDYYKYSYEYYNALSEWQKNLIPVKEGEETEKFERFVYSVWGKTAEAINQSAFNEGLQNGIEIPDEAVRIEETGVTCDLVQAGLECSNPEHGKLKKFAYLNNQPKKEESNEAIEFAEWIPKNNWRFHKEVGDSGMWRNDVGIVIIEVPTSPLYVSTKNLFKHFKKVTSN